MSAHTAKESRTALSAALLRAAGILEKTRPLCSAGNTATMCLFMLMVLLTFLDVFLRYFFNRPISGTVEFTELLMVIMYFSGLAKAQWDEAHVSMDIITGRLGPKGKARLGFATDTWSLAVLAWCMYALCRYALAREDWATSTWYIPCAPFLLFAAFGCFMCALAVLRDMLVKLAAVLDERRPAVALCTLAFAFGILLACLWLALHRVTGVSSVTLGVLGMTLMFGLFFLGMPVGFALMSTGFIFIANMRGLPAVLNMSGQFWFSTVASYDWSPIMFFLLMGYFCFHGRFGEDLYRCVRAFMGHCRGGLASGSICACTAFGAVVGDNLAGSVAMSAIALPEMRRFGYKDILSLGTLACSGTIGCLIPPSTSFIIYGILAAQSIGELFIAGVIPGLLCMLCFILMIWVWTLIDPSIAPPSPRTPLRDAVKTLPTAVPILAICVVTIGGMYAGVFTTTEGGSIGACSTLLLGVFLRRYSWKGFKKSLEDSSNSIVMCYTVLGGATALGYFVTMSRIPMALATMIAGLDMGPYWVLFAIIICMAFLGCFIPATPLILICVPIFLPIADLFQWNLIWFGVIMALIKNMASITPPFGINLFVLKGIADVPLGLMYRSAAPFVVGLFLCLGLIVAFPALSLWLPEIMR